MSTVLICDSGSSKSDWWFIKNGQSEHLLSTIGYNPYVHDITQLQEIINEVESSLDASLNVSEVHCYCAGADSDRLPIIRQTLKARFQSAHCKVYSDLLAVAHGLGQGNPCWVAIIGTGSNVAFFDGTHIEYQRESMGWFWGDEGSARHITKSIIVSYCRRNFDNETMKLLHELFSRSPAEMKQYVLNTPPLDVITSGLEKLADYWSYPAIQELSESSVSVLINDISKLQNLHQGVAHFSGSVAYFHRTFIRNELEKLDITCGEIVQFPIQKLINYHVKKD